VRRCSENLSTASNTVDVTTGTVAATYCASQGTDTNYEYIENVQLGDIDNSSTVGTGYATLRLPQQTLP
jgi:hypothetical protein